MIPPEPSCTAVAIEPAFREATQRRAARDHLVRRDALPPAGTVLERCGGPLDGGDDQPHARLKGVLFDMGDVLYDATVWRRWLLQLLARMGLHTHFRGLFCVWEHDFLDDVHCGRREYGEAFEAFLRAIGLSRGQSLEVLAASQAHKRELEAGTRPLPGVRTTLERLTAQGLVLGVLSDSESPAERLRQRLDAWGLGASFCTVVSSIDLGRCKPDAECYRAALAAMKLEADQVAFVGHDAAELAGAAAVGMRTWAFNYEYGAMADVYVAHFADLADCAYTAMRATTPHSP